MKYNIGFTLGDPSADGHRHSVDYHMVSNYSALEIDRDLLEEQIYDLNGAAYGLAYRG
jgi:hypothetical protein